MSSGSEYDSFGNLLDGREALTRYGYAGYERDTATGYYKTDARWYDPATGKWISEDPSGLGPDVNMYRYAGNGPTNWVDPSGRDRVFGLYDPGNGDLHLTGLPPIPVDLPPFIPPPGALQPSFNHAEFEYYRQNGLPPTGYLVIPEEPSSFQLAIEGALTVTGVKAVCYLGRGGTVVGRTGSLVTKLDDVEDLAHNAANFERYKDALRAAMQKPHAVDPKLKGYLNKLYRPDAKIGSGSTASAIRHELTTGIKVGGKLHSKKGKEFIGVLQKWLRDNPNARQCDRAAAENVLRDLQNAFDEL